MFTINNKSDYGLLMISELLDKKDYVPLSKLVAETNLPQRFIARIASDMVRSGILKSKEGKVGGYRLAKDLKKITLFDFISVFNHDIKMVKCEADSFSCIYGKLCSHKFFFKKVLNKIFVTELKKWTLADLIKG